MNLRILFPTLLLSVASLHAGSFGGPAPFRNGSPLPEGTDGRYQLVASATNVTGIISFAIADGIQTNVSQDNGWVMFVDGQVLSGSTNANISQGKVAGVLDSGTVGLQPADDGTISLPVAYIIPGNAASGQFSGRIDLSSPVSAISGKGTLTGTPSRTDQLIVISQSTITGVASVSNVPIIIPGSTLADVSYKIRGTRLTQTTSSSTSSSSTSN